MHPGVREQLEGVTRIYATLRVLTMKLWPTQPFRWSPGFSLENGGRLWKGSPGRHQRSAALYSIGSQFLSSHVWFQKAPVRVGPDCLWMAPFPKSGPWVTVLEGTTVWATQESLYSQAPWTPRLAFWGKWSSSIFLYLPTPSTLVPLIKRKFYLIPFPSLSQISQTWHSIKSRVQRSVWFKHEGNFVKSVSAIEKIASHQ